MMMMMMMGQAKDEEELVCYMVWGVLLPLYSVPG